MPLLAVRNLEVTFATPRGPARVVEDVSLDLERGERIGIVGESGSGKSMTALALMGLLPQGATARGRILLDGEDLLKASERRWCEVRGRRIAMVFQEPMSALNPVHPIGRQIAEGLWVHFNLSRREAAARAQRLLARVGLPAPRFSPDLYPHQLSGGQRQRVVLAIALACGPEILIADEPTTALDVTIQAQILDLIEAIVADEDMGLVMISHDLGIIARTTERMLVMYAGRIVERGPTEDVFERLAHPYTRALFAARPQLSLPAERGRRRLATIPGRVPEPHDKPGGCPFASRCPRVTESCRARFPEGARMGQDHVAHCLHPYVVPAPVAVR